MFESERSAPRPFDFMLKAEPEESYDAAMRAADALFSIPAPSPANGHDEVDANGHAQPQGGRDPAHPERNGGRILRVLEEEQPPEYEALEAEHAPKKRGRKPGSKNKPKTVVTAIAGPHEPPAPIWTTPIWTTPVQRHEPIQVPDLAPIAMLPAMPAARKITAIPANVVIATAAPSKSIARTGDKRFSWVRDKLKPGEDWKRRRLPRICW